jgi:hypothetical protein
VRRDPSPVDSEGIAEKKTLMAKVGVQLVNASELPYLVKRPAIIEAVKGAMSVGAAREMSMVVGKKVLAGEEGGHGGKKQVEPVSSAIVSSAIVSSAIVSSAIVSSAIVSSAIVSSAIVSSAIVGSAMVGSAMVGSAIVGSAMVGTVPWWVMLWWVVP